MSLVATQLSRIAILNPPAGGNESRSLLHYEAGADTVAAVAAAGYFNDVRELLNVGDRIMVIGNSIDDVAFLSVLTVPATGNVTTNILSADPGAFKIARGVHTTVDENDTIVTGLASVASVVATLASDPVAGCQSVTASIGDQAGAPAAGSILIKSWQATNADTTTVIAATTFGKLVNWIAIGT